MTQALFFLETRSQLQAAIKYKKILDAKSARSYDRDLKDKDLWRDPQVSTCIGAANIHGDDENTENQQLRVAGGNFIMTLQLNFSVLFVFFGRLTPRQR